MWRYSRCFAVNPNAATVGGDPTVADLGSVPGELSQQWAARLRPLDRKSVV
jgi:hypothetical protein